MSLIHPGGAGHDLDMADPQCPQMGDGGGMREAGKGTAQGFGYIRMAHGEAADMQFIENDRPWRVEGCEGGSGASSTALGMAAALSSLPANMDG